MNAINDKIDANKGLVYQQLLRFQMRYDPDAESLAYEALYRAVMTFDESTGNAFSTYATCCISNELRKYLRVLNRKRQLDIVSYHAPLDLSGEEDGCFLDVMNVTVADAETTLICNEECARIYKAFEAERALLSPLHRKIIDIHYAADGKLSQGEIGKRVGTTQVTVSRAISQFRHRLKNRLEETI
jgi:RNA polymerase sigma factor (sigma-70 family)